MISTLTINSKKVNVVAKIIEKRQPREVNTKFGRKLVGEAIIEDSTGRMSLVLWEDEINNVKEGETIKIENGYVTEWNGVLQLNVGKYGTMKVL